MKQIVSLSRHRHIAFVYFLIGQVWIWLSFALLAHQGFDERITFWTAATNGSIIVAVSALLVYAYARSRLLDQSKDNVLLQTVIDGTSDAVFVKDADGKYVMMNEAAARYIGQPVTRILGKTDTAIFDTESARQTIQSDQRVMSTLQPVTVEQELTMTGVKRTFLTTKSPFYDAESHVKGVVGISREITDRVHAKAQLRAERDRFEKLADAVPLALFAYITRPDGTVCMPYASKRIEPIFGISTAQLAEDASGLFSRIHNDDMPSLQASIDSSARLLCNWQAEFRVNSPVLGEIWVEGCLVPSVQPDGSTLWQGYLNNVTARKKTEAALRESEAQFRATFEQAAVGITHVDLTGRFLRVNRRFTEITSYSSEDLSSLTFQQITHPDDLSNDEALMQQLLDGERENYSLEKRYCRKDGSEVWVNLTVSLRRTNEGKPDHYISVIEDISARKQAETALRESEERFRAVVDQATDAFFLHDHLGRIVDANLAACESLDYTPEELAGMLPQAFDEEATAERLAHMAETFKSGKSMTFDTTYRRKNGSTFPVEVRSRQLNIGGQNYVVSIARDITERLRTEAAIREQESFVRGVLDSVSAHIAVLDPSGKIIAVNAAWREFNENNSSAPNQQIGATIGANYLTICEKSAATGCNDGALAITAIRRVLMGDSPWTGFEYTCHSPTERRWFEMAVTPLDLAQGGAVVSHIDITDRKRAELEATENRAKLAAALNSMSDAVFISDSQGRFVELNDAFVKFHKFKDRQECSLLHSEYANILEIRIADGELAPVEMWAVTRALRGEVGTNVEYRIRRKDIDVSWIGSYNFAPIRDAKGNIVGSVVVGRDVTAQKQAEEARSRLAAIVESSSDAIISKSLDGSIQSWNEGAERLFGYPASDVIGKHIGLVIPPERNVEEEQILTCIRNGILVANYDTERLTRNGVRIAVSLTISPIRDNDGKVIGASKIVHDISERKRAEASIRESEARFRTLVECMPNAVFIVAKGRISFCNPAAVNLLGARDRNQILNHTPLKFVHPDDHENVRLRIESIENNRPPLPVLEGHCVRLDDERSIPVQFVATPIKDQGTNASLFVVRNMSEQKRAEELLERQNAVLEQIAAGAPLTDTLSEIVRFVEDECPSVIASILLVDRENRLRLGAAPHLHDDYNTAIDGIEIGPNTGSCGTAAYTRKTVDVQDIATDPLWANYRDFALSHGLTACWSVPIFSSNRGTNPPEVIGTFALYNLFKKDREPYHTVLIDRAGHLASIAIESAQTATDLRVSEERFRTLVDFLPDAVFLNISGKVAFCNLSCVHLFGASDQTDLLGKTPYELHPPEYHELIRERIAAQNAENKPIPEIEEEIVRMDGRRVPVTVTALPIVHGGISANLVVLRDLTVLRRLEDQFREAQKMEAVGRLAGGVAHDFNNLLTVINGYADILLTGLPMGHVNRATISAIRSAGERAAGLTNQLLAFSRKAVIAPRVLDLNTVVCESDKLIRRLIGEDIRLVTSLESEPCFIQADANQIDQVLLNLAVNARDAMPDGGRLTIGTRKVHPEYNEATGTMSTRKDWMIELSVCDTGCGMTDEVKAKLFEPFFTTKGVGKGTGLGLAVVHGVVKQAGGHLSVQSTVGKGTTFCLLFPEVDPPVTNTASVAVNIASAGSETVLMVEDEDSVRALCKLSLESQGYRVLEAEDGASALELIRNYVGPIDLLLTDLVMPEMSGRELADHVRAARPEIRVLYVSGYTDDSAIVVGVREATDAFLQKPFTPFGLARKVRAVLDGRE